MGILQWLHSCAFLSKGFIASKDNENLLMGESSISIFITNTALWLSLLKTANKSLKIILRMIKLRPFPSPAWIHAAVLEDTLLVLKDRI